MKWSTASDRALRSAYRREVASEGMPRLARAGGLLFVLVSMLFLISDFYVHSDHFAFFASVRIGVGIVLAALALGASRFRPTASAIAIWMLAGGMLLVMIYRSGGPASDYYVGLALLFFTIPVLTPFSATQTAAIVGALVLGFLASPLFAPSAERWAGFGLHSLYLVASGFVAVASAGLLDRGRFAEFQRRRELERSRDELQALDRAKSRFTANVHHELRTPLTLLLSPLEAMLGGELGSLSQLQRAYLRTMEANAARLLRLINGVLDLARADDDALQLQFHREDVGALARRVVDAARPTAERKGVQLQTRGLADLPRVPVDSDALDKILVNLIANALKFTDRDGRIELRAEDKAGWIELAVTDNGAGIPQDQLERIFDRFAQADDSATRRFGGSGIGLALARELVEAHGGAIAAESAGPGRGATFRIRLPRTRPLQLPTRAKDTLPEPPSGSAALERSFRAFETDLALEPGGGLAEETRPPPPGPAAGCEPNPRAQPGHGASLLGAAQILVVEDQDELRQLLARILGREFRVRTARDGAEALSAIEEDLPDLVLTDLMMPSLSGSDLCRILKASDRTRGIPIVVLTARADRRVRIEALELGAEDYVVKPFHRRELLARVRSLLRTRALQHALAARNRELERANGELEASQRNLSLYASAVSHDLRSPLAAAAEALRLGLDRPESDRRSLFMLAGENLERADRMLEALRDLTRRVGRSEESSWIDMDRLMSELLEELELAGRAEPLPIRVVSSLGFVVGPREKLHHVFRNLVRNALEAVDGRPIPRIEIGRVDGPEPIFFVRDNGPGIPHEYRHRLFEPFRRGPGSRPENMGLGLALVQQLVEQQGGRVTVDSTPGQGASFRVVLPPERTEDDSTAAVPLSTRTAARVRSSRRAASDS